MITRPELQQNKLNLGRTDTGGLMICRMKNEDLIILERFGDDVRSVAEQQERAKANGEEHF